MTSAEAKCTHCKGTIGEDVTGRPMCYGCGPVEMIPPIIASPRRRPFAYGGAVFAGSRLRCLLCDYGAETDNAMDAHMQAIHPQPAGVTASPAYAAQVEGFHEYQRIMAEQAKARQRLVLDGVEATNDGGLRAVGYAQSRSFTRSEVLTVLRTLKADTGVVAGKEALDRAIRVFESMEGAR